MARKRINLTPTSQELLATLQESIDASPETIIERALQTFMIECAYALIGEAMKEDPEAVRRYLDEQSAKSDLR